MKVAQRGNKPKNFYFHVNLPHLCGPQSSASSCNYTVWPLGPIDFKEQHTSCNKVLLHIYDSDITTRLFSTKSKNHHVEERCGCNNRIIYSAHSEAEICPAKDQLRKNWAQGPECWVGSSSWIIYIFLLLTRRKRPYTDKYLFVNVWVSVRVCVQAQRWQYLQWSTSL